MRSMIKRLNIRGENLHLSTFSIASKKRSIEPFKELWKKWLNNLRLGISVLNAIDLIN